MFGSSGDENPFSPLSGAAADAAAGLSAASGPTGLGLEAADLRRRAVAGVQTTPRRPVVVAPRLAPQLQRPPIVSQPLGPFTDHGTLYRNIAGLPKLNWIERAAANIKNPAGRFVATWSVKGMDYVTRGYSLPLIFLVWGTLYLIGIFNRWGEAQSESEGGSLTDALLYALDDSAAFQAASAIIAIVSSGLWRKFCGVRKPDHKPYLNYIEHLKDISAGHAFADQALKKAVTNPSKPWHHLTAADQLAEQRRFLSSQDIRENDDVQRAALTEERYTAMATEESQQFISFHAGIIYYFAEGGDTPTEGDQHLAGNWEAIGYILRNLRQHFPFCFEEDRVITPEFVIQLPAPIATEAAATVTAPAVQVPAAPRTPTIGERMRGLAEAHLRSTGGAEAAAIPHSAPEKAAVFSANHGLLADLGLVPGQPVATPVVDAVPAAPAVRAPTLEPIVIPAKVERDLYNWPLLSEQDRGFFSVSEQERQRVQHQDWRSAPVIKSNKAPSRTDVVMRVTDYVNQLRMRRVGMLAKEGERKQAIGIVRSLLSGLLKSPLECDAEVPDARRGLQAQAELPYKCLQLVNLLRPGIQSGQWKNWRFFYSHDEIITEAFKRLSAKQQAWMIYTLMSGNDAGRLLALSILQDARLPVTTHFFGSSLAQFFRAYIKQFANPANPELHNEFREHLVWLTENTGGRISALLASDPALGSQLINFMSQDLPDNTFALRPFTAAAERPVREQDLEVVTYCHSASISASSLDSDAATETRDEYYHYQVHPRHDASQGFSVLPASVNRALVVAALEGESSNQNARQELAPEIFDYLSDPDNADTLPACFSADLRIRCQKAKRTVNVLIGQANRGLAANFQFQITDPFQLLAHLETNQTSLEPYFGEAGELTRIIGGLQSAALGIVDTFSEEVIYQNYVTHVIGGHGELGYISLLLWAETAGRHIRIWQRSYNGEIVFLRANQEVEGAPLDVLRETAYAGLRRLTPTDAPTAVAAAATAQSAGKATAAVAWPAHANTLVWGMPGATSKKASVLQAAQVLQEGAAQDAMPAAEAAIHRGVLQSGNLSAIHPLLISSEPAIRDRGFAVLASLLGDRGPQGMVYQHIFQDYVGAHYGEMASIAMLQAFEQWLQGQVESEDESILRGRFVAAVIKATEQRAMKMPDTHARAAKINTVFAQLYPQQNLFDILATLGFAFKEDLESRRRIFRLLFNDANIQLGASAAVPADLGHLNMDGQSDILASLVMQGLDGDVIASFSNCERVANYADLLAQMVAVLHKKHGIYDRLIVAIKNPSNGFSCEIRMHLAIALIDGLRRTGQAEAQQDILVVLQALHAGLGITAMLGTPAHQAQFQRAFGSQLEYHHLFNQLFEKLGIMQFRQVSLTLEALYLEMSFSCLQQAQAHDNVDVNRQRAWQHLADVVMQVKLHARLGMHHREQLIKILPLIVDGFGSDAYRYKGVGDSPEHQRLVHMTLAVLFRDPRGLEIKTWATDFRAMCVCVGGGDVAGGLQRMIDGLGNDKVLASTNLAEGARVPVNVNDLLGDDVTQIARRMMALALYSEYQNMPNGIAITSGGRAARHQCFDRMRQMLALPADRARENVVVSAAFDVLPFQDLGIAREGSSIKKLLIKDNGRVMSARSKVSLTATSDGMDDGMSGDAMPMSPVGRAGSVNSDGGLAVYSASHPTAF